MTATLGIIEALPDLEKGGATLVLVAVLIWIIKEFLKRLDLQDEAHRKERQDQDQQHQAAMRSLMENHSQERKDWVGKIEAAGDKYAKATTEQGDRIARALEDALRRPRPK